MLRQVVAQRAGGRPRPQQEHMVEAVEHALSTSRHLVVQAGTGTGKTLGYLVPAVHAGRRVVVSTATNQLGEQIVREDLPALTGLLPGAGGRRLRSALLKGRQNYLCRRKVADLLALAEPKVPAPAVEPPQALFDLPVRAVPDGADRADRADGTDGAGRGPGRVERREVHQLLAWAQGTATGDRSHAPAVTERSWAQVSTDAAGCPGAGACPLARDCFAERARAAARTADVVVTNHAQVAHDLRSPTPLLGGHDVLVLDEAHEVEAVLSAVWGTRLAPEGAAQTVAAAARRLPRGRLGEPGGARAQRAVVDLGALADALESVPAGPVPRLPAQVDVLLGAVAGGLGALVAELEGCAAAPGASRRLAAERRRAAGEVGELRRAVTDVLGAGAGSVRWLEAGPDQEGAVLRVAPLRVGPRLMALLGDRTLVATSATLATGGSFDPVVRALGLADPLTAQARGRAGDAGDGGARPPRGFDTVDVGSPFDHDRQALLYVPGAGFPAPSAPSGTDRTRHAGAVLDDLTALVRAAGGRTLALFTTRRAAAEAAAHLRDRVATPVLLQGEAPPSRLVADFARVEESTLCATAGFWHGVDVPGPSLSCVVIDKIPFAPAGDPLMSARRAAADRAGRDGFTEVFVAGAATTLAQGAGRLVRGTGDRGVVAVLDPRLVTRSYGAVLQRSLPPMRRFSDRAVVEAALVRLTGGPAAAGAVRRAAPRRAAPGQEGVRALALTARDEAPTSAA